MKITMTGESRERRPDVGMVTIVSFSDGTRKVIQRLNALESNGLAGWHDVDGSIFDSYLADTSVDAVAVLLKRKNA